MRGDPIDRQHGEGRFEGYEWVARPLHTTIFAERALAVDSGLHVLSMNPLQFAIFLKICVVRKSFDTCQPGAVGNKCAEIIHLKVDVPSLSAAYEPLSLDDEHGDSADTTLSGCINLIVDRLNVFIRVKVCDRLT